MLNSYSYYFRAESIMIEIVNPLHDIPLSYYRSLFFQLTNNVNGMRLHCSHRLQLMNGYPGQKNRSTNIMAIPLSVNCNLSIIEKKCKKKLFSIVLTLINVCCENAIKIIIFSPITNKICYHGTLLIIYFNIRTNKLYFEYGIIYIN